MNSTGISVVRWVLILLLALPVTLFSQNQSALDIALRHLQQEREKLSLTAEDIANYKINDYYTSRHNGVTHVYLKQLHEGIEVPTAIININVLSDGRVLNMGSRFVADLAARVNATTPTVEPTDALKNVIEKFAAPEGSALQIKEQRDGRHFVFEHVGIALEPISVDLVFHPLKNKEVRLAWQVKLYQLDAQHWWDARVDALTGEIMDYQDIVIHCDFSHSESCNKDHHHVGQKNTNHTTKTAPKNTNAFTPVMPNSYHVFPLPLESPNHGDREIVVDPADLTASPFGWHDTDGATGAEFTITRGNNVHAYQDIFDSGVSMDDEPDGGALLEFDFPFDPNNNFPYTQVEGGVVNLFYWNNVIHDLWYHYGFDEVSGNFQQNNYGNGGAGGDYVRAEALDGSGRNNANFAPTNDGNRPRMQMYYWGQDNLPPPPTTELVVTAPVGVAGDYGMVGAAFGGEIPTTPIISEVVLVDDGTNTASDACEELINGADIDGKIALIDRGNCQFGTKALRAENAGAVAVIICNNENADPFPMLPGADGDQVTIPAVMMSLEDCNVLKLDLPLSVEFSGPNFEIPTPGPAGRDADYDNGVIVHEYTHGISSRLTGGPNQGGCLSNFEQAGEGWSDWFALVMQTTSADNAEEPRGIGTYSINQPTNGDGIRDFPYSRDMSVDPHTYADINDVSVPHGVGSVWAVMIWDLYWNLVDVYGFDDDLYNGEGGNNRAMQLVLDGLKLQACNPTFLDARDAILAADEANYDGIHRCLIWETFARRGLGVNAQEEGIENFEVPWSCDNSLKISKSGASEIQSSSIITYTVGVKNDSPDARTNVIISDILPDGVELVTSSVSCPSATVDNNNVLTISLGDLAPGDSVTCTYDVLTAAAPFTIVKFEDYVENGGGNWTVSSPVGPASWGFTTASYEGDFAWFAENLDESSEQILTTANTIKIEGNNPILSIWHRYDTENTWDGGVIEISLDNGNNWIDANLNFIQNGYNGTLEDNPDNVLSERNAFTGSSGGYINSLLDMGNYLNQDMLVRFRLGCDGLVGGDGWYIDNIVFYDDFYSITNTACITSDAGENKCANTSAVVFENPTSTEELVESFRVAVFPNPTDGKIFLTIENENNSAADFYLYSLEGKLLKSKQVEFSNGTFDFDLSDLPRGIYTLRVQTQEGQVVRKVVVQ
ncbi:MAG: T9SS-dependent M36 family metallopeptidase [Bacteroidota bacterium]